MRPRRLVSLLIAGCMMVSLVPASAVTAFAETASDTSVSEYADATYVASIGDKKYASIDEALKAAGTNNATTIKLENDINGLVTIPLGAEITLDLNGKTISNDTDDAVDNKGKLTITDSLGTGSIISGKLFGVAAAANSTTIINYANITGKSGAVGGFGMANSESWNTHDATIEINDGVFTGKENAVVFLNGNNRDGGPNTVTINGGIFNGEIVNAEDIACGICASWKDNVTVNGGTFKITNGAGIVARGGNVTVTGGTFITTGDRKGFLGDSKVQVPCSALVFDSDSGYPGKDDNSKIEVSGGTFTSEADAVAFLNEKNDSIQRIEVSGGTFSSDPSKFCVKGKVAKENSNDGYTVQDRTYNVDTKVDVDEDPEDKNPDTPNEGTAGEPVEIAVTAKGEDVQYIDTLTLKFSDPNVVSDVSITNGKKTVSLTKKYEGNYEDLSVAELNALFDENTDASENGIATLAADPADASAKTELNFTFLVTYTKDGDYSVNFVFKDVGEKEVTKVTAPVQIGPKADDAGKDDNTGDNTDSGDGAGAVIAGVVLGTGAVVLAYHVGTEIYAEQVLGQGVAVPSTREEVALKAWELAGKPAVAVEGEPLSETAQAERWVVESGLMQNESDGTFNGQKKMTKLAALHTLSEAKKLG